MLKHSDLAIVPGQDEQARYVGDVRHLDEFERGGAVADRPRRIGEPAPVTPGPGLSGAVA